MFYLSAEDNAVVITKVLNVVYAGTDLQSVLSESLHLQDKIVCLSTMG